MQQADLSRLPGRLRWRIRWARIRHWEFWPGWLYYIPIVLWILLCGLRFRHWTAFSATNPGMDNGSVVGERKSHMLLALQQARPDLLPRTELLDAELDKALASVRQLGEEQGWPLVLKPNIGQRGRGVAIVHSLAEAEAYLHVASFAVLTQAYVEGQEYGIFLRRLPGRPDFEISSITHKALPFLSGNGRDNLRTLILAHPRAWLIAPMLFERHREQLGRVLKESEDFQLVELGAHCRGSEFRDGSDCHSPALLQTMQALAHALPGFDFGRIDLRCPDAQSLRAGKAIQVLEINGVTSEPAHYYHPGTSYWRGLAGFCAHWTRAFALGRDNLRQQRATALPPLRLLQLFREDLRRFPACERASQAALEARNLHPPRG